MLLTPPQNFSAILSQPVSPPMLLAPKPNLIAGIPDGILALMAPVIAYWTYSTFWHIIDVYELAEKYRIHPSEEEQARNKATLKEVLVDVLFQHVVQTFFGYVVYRFDPKPVTGNELYQMWHIKHKYLPSFVPDSFLWFGYNYGWSLLRLGISLCLIDTWQYWLHRIMHENRALYRRFHSRHHRLYVPYSYGALYNDPVEGFLLDTAGTGLSAILTGLSPREALVLYTFATMKTVDDHCGYRLPFDPFQMIFPNNALYHDIHHQNWGFKSNYSQPFFTFWDRLTRTQYEFVHEYKEKQKQITLEKYKEFLEKRKQKKEAMSESSSTDSVIESKKTI
ncbi:putative sphingolipid C4-hydroxylase [Clavispora lusitaniae]|uniref:Sphingolipid C4-hydroxylase n=1 Tax=Clavispora lusitaniae TaxID=36911 RepID=A0ACD0WR47_CLALS|nr:putative sphingolipid C4-hydroxylase [Clavispora lusitaniae]QFZ35653.1 putative sphingolipid C4-hydroxylase [Clavispora lusitaniae]QFZ41335.1 putative sphingolipid C4-hydroxylase [Clavispora lusitaniae]QFZ47013.1 putative sphingolipid C4-hydroxylase [Clavispora lusitaniae]QFZ52690.1 putative sphingolipid C4-hydroxylase [Clavispora lusitaniae]